VSRIRVKGLCHDSLLVWEVRVGLRLDSVLVDRRVAYGLLLLGLLYRNPLVRQHCLPSRVVALAHLQLVCHFLRHVLLLALRSTSQLNMLLRAGLSLRERVAGAAIGAVLRVVGLAWFLCRLLPLVRRCPEVVGLC